MLEAVRACGCRTLLVAVSLIAGSTVWCDGATPIAPPLRTDTPVHDIASELDRFVADEMVARKVPGVSIALVRQGEVVWTKAYGIADRSAASTVTSETLFQAASLGKPVAAYAALRLCNQGKIELDAPMSRYVNEPFVTPRPGEREITLRDVLSHTSGLSNDMVWRNRRPEFAPGFRYSYSGVGYQYLQAVVENVTGRTFNDAMNELVFVPLKMSSSSYDRDLPDEAQLARGYFPLWHWQLPLPGTALLGAPNAASSLRSTSGDIARFAAALMTAPRTGAGACADMFAPQVRVDELTSWGLGIGIERHVRGEAFWQWGSNPGFKSLLVGYRSEGIAVVVMTNGSNGLEMLKITAQLALGGPTGVFWEALDADDPSQ